MWSHKVYVYNMQRPLHNLEWDMTNKCLEQGGETVSFFSRFHNSELVSALI